MRGENDVVEHGESAEYKTQSLSDFYTAATKMIFDDWSFFNRSQTESQKQQNIQDNKAATMLQICHTWQ